MDKNKMMDRIAYVLFDYRNLGSEDSFMDDVRGVSEDLAKIAQDFYDHLGVEEIAETACSLTQKYTRVEAELLEAACMVFDRDYITSLVYPLPWVEEHFIGQFESLADWAVNIHSVAIPPELSAYVRWGDYAKYVIDRDSLLWTHYPGGGYVYIFNPGGLEGTPVDVDT